MHIKGQLTTKKYFC